MHFKLSETVEATDVDLVVRTLEGYVRGLAKDVVRSEQQLIAFGIGPSPVAKNAKDRAVFYAERVDAGTNVTVDVSYQASGLLGNVSQDEVVREKILDAFQRTRTDVRYVALGRAPMRETRPVAMVEMPSPVVQEEVLPVEVVESAAHRVAPEVERLEHPAPVEVGALRAPVAEVAATQSEAVAGAGVEAVRPEVILRPVEDGKRAAVSDSRANWTAAPEARAEDSKQRVATIDEGAVAAAVREPVVAGRSGGSGSRRVAAGRESGPNHALREGLELRSFKMPLETFAEESLRGSRGPRVVGWTLGWLAVLGIAAGVGWRLVTPHRVESPTIVQSQADGTMQDDTGEVGPEALPPVDAAAKVEEQDLNAWLLNWAEAIESRNAVTQTGYYADPVDFYFLTPHVGHAALLKDVQAAIDADPNATLKIEKIDILKQTENSATVMLVKHFTSHTAQSDGRERRLVVVLKVKRIDGDWKIAEEHNMRSAPMEAVR